MAALPVQKPAPKPPSDTLEQQFRRLETQWKADTLFLSDPGKMMAHHAMRAIVALGQEVVPIILCDLRAKPSLLVWALPEITGEDLTPPKAEDGFLKWDVVAARAAWLEWGQEKGLL